MLSTGPSANSLLTAGLTINEKRRWLSSRFVCQEARISELYYSRPSMERFNRIISCLLTSNVNNIGRNGSCLTWLVTS